MKNFLKTGLQLMGLAAWATAWIGGGLLLLKRDIDKEEKLAKEHQNGGDLPTNPIL